MNQRGALTSFLLCKLGIVFAVAALIGSATAMSASLDRTAQRDDLGEVAERVTDALEGGTYKEHNPGNHAGNCP